jgi:hypothetical protein
VPVACLASGVLFLNAGALQAVRHVLSYSGYVYRWTWSGTWLLLGHAGAGYNSSLSGVGSLLVVAGVAIILWLLRRRPPEVRALGALAAVLLCTAGFGTQYLLWVAPLTIALVGRRRNEYMIAATAWAAIFYLSPFGPFVTLDYLIGLSWLPAAILVAIIAAQVRGKPAELAGGADLPASGLETGGLGADELGAGRLGTDGRTRGPDRRPELVRTGAVARAGRSGEDTPAAGLTRRRGRPETGKFAALGLIAT